MARGRMISKCICLDRKIADLSDDTSRLAFTWLITHADVKGRVIADPMVVYSLLFPRGHKQIDADDMQEYMQEWHDAGLVRLYIVDDEQYLEFCNFNKHNKVYAEKEAPSSIPDPPEVTPDLLQSNSGATTELLPVIEKKTTSKENKQQCVVAEATPESFAARFLARYRSLFLNGGQLQHTHREKAIAAIEKLMSNPRYVGDEIAMHWLEQYHKTQLADYRNDNQGRTPPLQYIVACMVGWIAKEAVPWQQGGGE